MLVLMTLSDLEKRDARGPFFMRNSVHMLILFDQATTTKSCTVTRERRVYGPTLLSILSGWAPASPKFFSDPTYDHTVWSEETKFSIVTCGSGMYFNRVMHESCPKVAGPSISLEPATMSYICHMVWHSTTNFAWWSDYLRGKFLQGRPLLQTWPKIFVTDADARSVCSS